MRLNTGALLDCHLKLVRKGTSTRLFVLREIRGATRVNPRFARFAFVRPGITELCGRPLYGETSFGEIRSALGPERKE